MANTSAEEDFLPTRRQMQDPLVAEWTADRIRAARLAHDKERERRLVELLDEAVVARHVAGPWDDARSGLLEVAPDRMLAPLVPFLLKEWKSTPHPDGASPDSGPPA